MSQIQMHDVTIVRTDRAALALLMPESLTQPIPWPEFHCLFAWPRVRRAEIVVLQIAIIVLVDEDSPFATRTLGDQYAGARQAGRVILHELHVLERHAGPVSHRHAVSCFDRPIGRKRKHAARAAGGNDDGLRAKESYLACAHFDCGDAVTTAVGHHQVG